MLPAHKLGKSGEDQAASFLRGQGYRIFARNFKSAFGEIDIVAREKNTLVFVEVKTRSDNSFGFSEESITPWKMRRIIKACQYYLLKNNLLSTTHRIDVIAINRNKLSHFKNVTL